MPGYAFALLRRQLPRKRVQRLVLHSARHHIPAVHSGDRRHRAPLHLLRLRAEQVFHFVQSGALHRPEFPLDQSGRAGSESPLRPAAERIRHAVHRLLDLVSDLEQPGPSLPPSVHAGRSAQQGKSPSRSSKSRGTNNLIVPFRRSPSTKRILLEWLCGWRASCTARSGRPRLRPLRPP